MRYETVLGKNQREVEEPFKSSDVKITTRHAFSEQNSEDVRNGGKGSPKRRLIVKCCSPEGWRRRINAVFEVQKLRDATDDRGI